MSYEESETLLGHRLAYFRPTEEEMREAYVKAEQNLHIAEADQLRRDLKDVSTTFRHELDALKLKVAAALSEKKNQLYDVRDLASEAEKLLHDGDS